MNDLYNSSISKIMEPTHLRNRPLARNKSLIPVGIIPKGKMVQVLFEPKTVISDSLTYDITAWSLPYAYGLEAYGFNGDLELMSPIITKINQRTIGIILMSRKPTLLRF